MSNLNMTSGSAATNASQKMRMKSQSIVDSQEMRRRREEEGVQIRKSKREQQLTKKRNVTGSSDTTAALDSLNDPLLDDSSLFGANSASGATGSGAAGQSGGRPEITEKLVEMLYSDTEDDQLVALRRFRKMLSVEPNPPIDQVIRTGILPRFVQLLQNSNNSLMQFEAAWTLTNIASGNSAQTRMVIQAGAVPIFISLMSSQYYDVREQAVWALGNITGDSPEFRDYVINCSFIQPLMEILNSNPSIAMKRNAVWAISNCCRGKNPAPDFAKLLPVVPNLIALLHENDLEVIADACWAISYLCDGPNEKIQSVIDAGGCQRLVELLMHNDAQITQAALRAVGNIVTGDDLQTQVMINCSVLTCLHNLLVHGKEGFRKEACWSLSNVTAGTKEQIDAVIEEGIVPSLIFTLQCGEFRTRKEAAWALTNITSGGNAAQVRFLVENGCIPPFCDLLTVMDTKIILVALTGLQNILRFGESETNSFTKVNPYATLIEECYGLDKIEFLQTHENNDIYQKAYEIVCTYFSSGAEGATNLAPATDSTNKYQFETDQAIPEGGFNF